ncbi:lipoyl synthase [bacterium]|nr:MAG: lipoyl synthase [bacterium]
MESKARNGALRKPGWLKIRPGAGGAYPEVKRVLREQGLHTICEEARCPNRAECWKKGTATFLILGDRCTRGCGFCAVERGTHGTDIEGEELLLAKAVSKMNIRYAVITSVTRDDLSDGGAGVFAKTIGALRVLPEPPKVEILIPDFLGEPLKTVCGASPDVLAHNIEVVKRLSPTLRHPRFSYEKSLAVLKSVRELYPSIVTKSSVLLGLGESREEIEKTMEDIFDAGVRILVLGQYLQPSKENAPVQRYVAPEEFDSLAEIGRRMGFGCVCASPLARTSYMAETAYRTCFEGK